MKNYHDPEFHTKQQGIRVEYQETRRSVRQNIGSLAMLGIMTGTALAGYQYGYRPIAEYAHNHHAENPHGVDDRRRQVEQEQRHQAEIDSAPQLVPTADQAPTIAEPASNEQTYTAVLPDVEA